MEHRYRVFLVFTVVITFGLAGCASFREGTLPPPSSWPPALAQGKKSISVIVTGEAMMEGRRGDVPLQMVQQWQVPTIKAYRDSGLFSEVKAGPAQTDLRAEVHIRDMGEGSKGMAIVSGLTLTLFPATGHDRLVVQTTIKDANGENLGTFEKTETVNFWIQFFLIFIMPFNWPPTVVSDTLYDLSRAIIVEAHAHNFF
ncbi:MAG: hypothetical protein KC643_31870 [Nitrospira sp.]|nr:hypothetical protein [Nitrospira sp.]